MNNAVIVAGLQTMLAAVKQNLAATSDPKAIAAYQGMIADFNVQISKYS